MKKTAIILAVLLLLSLCTACGTQSSNADISDSSAAPDKSSAETVEAADASEAVSSPAPDEGQPETSEAASAVEDAGSGAPEATQTEEAGNAVFSWQDYSMTFPFMTVDMAGYGVEDFQDSMVLVRLAAVDGTITYNDFHQNMFELVDPEGNTHPCKFFIIANTVSSPVVQGMPADQQDYIDMLFELGNATSEDLAASQMNVYEEEGGQPLTVPLKSVSQDLAEHKPSE